MKKEFEVLALEPSRVLVLGVNNDGNQGDSLLNLWAVGSVSRSVRLELELKTQYFKLTNPHSTCLSIQVRSWVFRSDQFSRVGRVFRVDGQPY